MTNPLELTSSWVRPHLTVITYTFVATVLVLYGGEINRFIRDTCKPYHLLVRVSVFMLVCAFGYGWATNKLAGLLKYLLSSKVGDWSGILVAAIFIGLGFLAERKNNI